LIKPEELTTVKTVKIILNEDVKNLGEEGDICEVKPGYARNFLIPQGLAMPHTKGNLATLESKRNAIEKRKEEKRKNALGMKEKLEAESLNLKVTAGASGKLFGSITNSNVADELQRLGYQIERKKIDLSEHNIKMVGNYQARVKLYGGEVAEIALTVEGVAPSSESAKTAKKADAPKQELREETKEEIKEDVKATSTEAPVEEAQATSDESSAAEESVSEDNTEE
jgi:large subunit ribosomal protein L9